MIEVGYLFGPIRIARAEGGNDKSEQVNRWRFAGYPRINNDRVSPIMLIS